MELEYLSAISKGQGNKVGLFYDSDIFGTTDNVFHSQLLNRIFRKDKYIIKKIKNFKPSLIVFSVILSNYKWTLNIVKEIKSFTSIPIVFIGLYTTLVPDEIMENKAVDYIMAGEINNQWPRFLKLIELKNKLSNKSKGVSVNVKNLWYRKNGKITFSGWEKKPVNLDSLPLPDKLLFENYINQNDSYTAYTSRGCIYKCSYCEEGAGFSSVKDSSYRRRSVASIINELKIMKKKYNFKEIIFKDSCFNLDKKWLKKFIHEYVKHVKVPFKCFANIQNFDKETAELLKYGGCYCIEFGIQTWNERIRKKILNRFETNKQARKVFGICDTIGLRYDIDHMFGLPGETVEDHILAAKEYSKLKFLNRVKVHNLVYFPKLPLLDYAFKSGYIGKAYYDMVEKGDEKADFFTSSRELKEMSKINENFRRFFKVISLFPSKLVKFMINKKLYRIFRFIPKIFIIMGQLINAIMKNDLRFKIYLKYYPLKIKRAFPSEN